VACGAPYPVERFFRIPLGPQGIALGPTKNVPCFGYRWQAYNFPRFSAGFHLLQQAPRQIVFVPASLD